MTPSEGGLRTWLGPPQALAAAIASVLTATGLAWRMDVVSWPAAAAVLGAAWIVQLGVARRPGWLVPPFAAGVVTVMGAFVIQAAFAPSRPFPIWPPAGPAAWPAFFVSLPVAALTTNLWIIGRRAGRIEHGCLIAAAYAVPVALWWAGAGRGVWLPLATVPSAIRLARRLARAPTRESMIALSPEAAQLLLFFAALFAVGLAVVA